ncbi:MAG: hypothetical protein GY732_01790 [Gammaproteobacteria bacterium]|nr:hypothetical protein [Gammaproteobacteria bacterium]
MGYVQDKVREGETGKPVEKPAWAAGYGREGALGYERYIAIEHMDKVRPGTGREGSLGCVRRDCFGLNVGNKLPTVRLET